MTIEQADKTLLEFYHYIKGDVHFCGYNEDNVLTTIDFVRETMRKYQKIKHIISKWDAGIYDDEGLCDAEVLEMIGDEVYENGNTD